MPRPEYPLSAPIRRGLATALPHLPWHLPAERLGLGEESAAYRIGAVVVRVGPVWRTDEEMAWFGAVAAAAHAAVPEALAPLAPPLRLAGHPVTVWPYVDAAPITAATPAQRAQAARLLAGVHAALAPVPHAAVTPMPQAARADLDDPDLDAWLAEFDRTARPVQPLHGDYWPGNTLADAAGRIVAVLDWDDAWVQCRERELAHAAWEWGDGLGTGGLAGAREFLAAYGGPGLDDVPLRQLIRERLRYEIRYAASRPGLLDDADRASHAAQTAAFHSLRPI